MFLDQTVDRLRKELTHKIDRYFFWTLGIHITVLPAVIGIRLSRWPSHLDHRRHESRATHRLSARAVLEAPSETIMNQDQPDPRVGSQTDQPATRESADEELPRSYEGPSFVWSNFVRNVCIEPDPARLSNPFSQEHLVDVMDKGYR